MTMKKLREVKLAAVIAETNASLWYKEVLTEIQAGLKKNGLEQGEDDALINLAAQIILRMEQSAAFLKSLDLVALPPGNRKQ